MKDKAQAGFSLIEIILYIGILAVLFVFLLAIFQDAIFIKSKVSQKIDNLENAQFALNKMVWYLQNAQSLNTPLLGQTSNTLSLNLADSAQNPVNFYVESGQLRIKTGSNAALSLTNGRIKVDNLTFTNNGFVSEPAVLQINLQVENVSNFWKIKPLTLQTSVKTEK